MMSHHMVLALLYSKTTAVFTSFTAVMMKRLYQIMTARGSLNPCKSLNFSHAHESLTNSFCADRRRVWNVITKTQSELQSPAVHRKTFTTGSSTCWMKQAQPDLALNSFFACNRSCTRCRILSKIKAISRNFAGASLKRFVMRSGHRTWCCRGTKGRHRSGQFNSLRSDA